MVIGFGRFKALLRQFFIKMENKIKEVWENTSV
jgi:hypothetical protein